MQMFIAILFLLPALSLYTVQGALILPQGRIPIRAYGLNQNYSSEYRFTADFPTNVYTNAWIETVFPPGFMLTSDCASYIRTDITSPGYEPFECSKTSTTSYRIEIGQIISGKHEIYLQGITNPSGRYGSGSFKIRTYSGTILMDENDFFGDVPLLGPTVYTNNATAKIIGYTKVNQGSKFAINFAVQSVIPSGISIKIDLPPGFTTENPICVFESIGEYLKTEALPDSRKVLCENVQSALQPGQYYKIVLLGVVNPNVTGIYTDFGVQFMRGDTPNVLESIVFPSQIEIDTGSISISVVSSNLYRRSNATHIFQMTFDNDVPQSGELWIAFSNSFSYLGANCVPLKGIYPADSNGIQCIKQSSNTEYQVTGFTTISGTSQTEIQIDLQNPLNNGTYIVQVYTLDSASQKEIDRGSYNLVIQDVYGSTDILSAHALQFSNPLGAGETGSLEFTFFLNTLLPATPIGTQAGQIIIEIYPQIPQPPSPSTVVCYFFETYPAETCIYDTSNSTMTKITIHTPTDMDYYQSEIPIVVTTEGALAPSKNGLKLPDLVQRYNFYMYFTINGQPIHEVSYAEYVPIAKIIPDTDFTITPIIAEANEYTLLKIDFQNNYIALNSQYDFVLNFTHTNNAWEPNLGWGAKTVWYQKYDYPCIVEGIGSNYYCELRPGTALSTDSLITVMTKGNMSLSLGSNVTFYFPKIQLGSNSGDSMLGLFKIREYTPGKLTSYIDIYTNTFSRTGLIAQDSSTTYTASSGITYSNLQINGLTDVSTSFTCVTGATAVFYAFPSVLPVTTSSSTVANCDGSAGVCYVFGKSVNWVYHKPTAAISGTTCHANLSSFTTLYPYSMWITVPTRVVKSDANNIVNRINLNRLLPVGSLTTTPASIAMKTTDTETYQNTVHIMEITFVTNYDIPLNGWIILDLTGMQAPATLQAIATAGLTATTTLGVVFTQVNTSEIKITNFNLVTAGSTVTVDIRLLLGTSSSPQVKVTTYYSAGLIIDQGGPVTVSPTLTLTLGNFQSFLVSPNRPQNIVHVTQDGTYKVTLTPSFAGYTSGYLQIEFASGFSLPNSTWDDLVCLIGTTRRSCSFTSSSPLIVRIPYTTDWSAGVASDVSIYTDYSKGNKKGIVAPTTAGWYQVVYKFVNSSGSIKEANMDYVFVPPAALTRLRIESAMNTANVFNMYTVTLQVSVAIPAYSSGGRFYVDFPTGTNNYANDLGTGLETGDYIGCDFEGGITTSDSVNSPLKCRLIESKVTGQQVSVEVINFSALAVATDIIVRIARIKNPATTTNTVFGLTVRMNTFITTTGVTTYMQYSPFALTIVLLNTASPTTVSVPPPAEAEPSFTGSTGQTNQPFNILIYTPEDLSINDYFVIELPTDIKILNPLSNCPTAATGQCWSFPDAGWVVYKLTSAVAANITTVNGNIENINNPAALSTTGYTIYGYAWISQAYQGLTTYSIGSTSTATHSGVLSAISIAAVEAETLVQNRKSTELLVSFTISADAPVPATGSIQIRFPSTVIPDAQCRSAVTIGSALVSQTGEIACEVQGNSWYITNFAELPVSSAVMIYGTATMPSVAGATDNFQIFTYENQDTNIAANGQVLDKSTAAGTLNIAAYSTMSIDTTVTSYPPKLIRAVTNNFHPLTFDFITTAVSVSTTGYIQVRLPASNFARATLPTSGVLYCYFIRLLDNMNLPCKITTSGTTSYDQYQLVPTVALSAGTSYRGIVTTKFADSSNDGIMFPSAAGVYEIILIASDGTTFEKSTFPLEVLPSSFSSMSLRSYIVEGGAENLIEVALQVPTTSLIAITDTIVIEIPVKQNSTNLFAEDLGLGLYDQANKICEKISTLPAALTFSCYFLKGSRDSLEPAKIVINSLSVPAQMLQFAFTVINPTPTFSAVIPVTIYAQTGTARTKTYYDYLQEAIIVVTDASGTDTESSTPTLSSTTLGATSTLTINVKTASAINVNDAYLIKMPVFDSATAATSTSPALSGATATVIKLPLNRWVIVKPQGSVSGDNSLAVDGIVNPSQALDTSVALTFYAYVSYYTTFQNTKVSYTNPLSNTLTATTAFTGTGATFVASRTTTQDLIDLTITINNNFASVQLVIVLFPAELTPSNLCREAASSAVELKTCVVSGNYASITVNPKSTYSGNINFIVKFSQVATSATAGAVSNFGIHIYSSPSAAYASDNFIIFKVDNVNSALTLTAKTYDVPLPVFAEWEQVPYLSDVYPQANNKYGPLKFQVNFPSTVTTVMTIEVVLGASLIQSTTTNTKGDITDNTLVCYINDGTNTYTAGVTYDATNIKLVISGFSSNLASGTVLTFLVQVKTQFVLSSIVKTGLMTSSATNAYFKPKITVLSAGVAILGTELEPFYIQTQTLFPFSIGQILTTKISAENIIELMFTPPSAINMLILEFPIKDDNGNMWPDVIASSSYISDGLIPCAGFNVAIPTGGQIACRLYLGSSSGVTRPSTITITGFTSTTAQFQIILNGIVNPATAGINVNIYARAFSGSTHIGSSFIRSAYQTISTTNDFTAVPADTNYVVSSPTPWSSSTFTFKTGVALNPGSFVRVTLDPTCSVSGTLTTSLSTTVLAPAIMQIPGTNMIIITIDSTGTALAVDSTYTISGIQCQGLNNVQFELLHQTSDSLGELRTSDLQQAPVTVTLTGTPTFTTNSLYTGQSSVTGRAEIDLSAFVGAAYYPVASGFSIKIVFQNFIIADNSISSCLVYAGLTQSNEAMPIGCSAEASNTLKISGFSAISTTVPLSFEIVFETASAFVAGTTDVYIYMNDADYTTDTYILQGQASFTAPSEITLPTINVGTSGISTTGVSPGNSNDIVITVPAATFSTDPTPDGTSLRIALDVTSSILKSTSTCSTSNTADYDPTTCVIDATNQYITIAFTSTAGTSITNLPTSDITITDLNPWPIDGSKVFAFLQIFDGSSTTYSSSGGYILSTGAYTATTTMLHTTGGEVNEFGFTFSAPIDLSSSHVFAVVSSDVTLPTSVDYFQIDCSCTQGSTALSVNCYSNAANNRITVHPQTTIASGSSQTCYIPEITNGGGSSLSFQYQILDIISGQALYSSASINEASTTTGGSGTATIATNYPSSILLNTAISFSLAVTTPDALTSGAVVYVDLNQAGPILSTCPSSSTFSAVRCYTLRKNIVVGVLSGSVSASGSVNLFSSTSLTFPNRLYGDTSKYLVTGFVANGGQILSTASHDYSASFFAANMASTIAIDSLSPSQRDLTALYLVSFTIGTTPVPTGDGTNGGMIILQHPTGVTTSSGCTASGAGVYYNCVASSANRTYTVYSTNAAIPAGTVLTIFAHNTNPATWTAPTLNVYYNYDTTATNRVTLLAGTFATLPTINSTATTTITETNRRFLPFFVDYDIQTTRAPLRFRFSLDTSLSEDDSIMVILPANEFSWDTTSSLICFFKVGDGRFFTRLESKSCSLDSGTLTSGYQIKAVVQSTLADSVINELVIMTNSASSANFALLSTANKDVTLTFTVGGALSYARILTIYPYQSSSFTLSSFYYTSSDKSQANILIIKGSLPTTLTAFAATTLVWEFDTRYNGFSNSLLSTSASDKSQVTCGYAGFATKSGNLAPFCAVVYGSGSQFTPSKLSFENYGTVSSSVEFYFYNIENPTVDNNIPVITLKVMDTVNSKLYSYRIWNPYLAVTGAITPGTGAGDYPTPSSLVYQASITSLTFPSVTWPTGMDCATGVGAKCKLMIQYNGVFYKPLSSTAVNVGTTPQTPIGVDLVNSRIFVAPVTTLTPGTSYTLQLSDSGFVNPSTLDVTGGEFDVYLYRNFEQSYEWVFSTNPPVYTAKSGNGTTTLTCTNYNSIYSTDLAKGSRLSCTLSLTVLSAGSTFTKIEVVLKAAGTNYITTDSYCAASITPTTPASTTTISSTMLGCHRDALVSGNSAFGITGFTYGGNTTFALTFRLTAANLNTINIDVNLQRTNSANTYVTLETFSGSLTLSPINLALSAPTSLQFSNIYQFSNLISATAPLVLQLTTLNALSSSSDSIMLQMSSDYAPSGSSTALLCIVRDSSYNTAILARCTYSTNTYTLLSPHEGLPTGVYFVKVTTRDQTSNGVVFPTAISRSKLLVTVTASGSTVSVDVGHLSPAPSPFSKFSVNNWNSIVASQGYLIITLTLPTAIPADLATNEEHLILEFPKDYYTFDLGASNGTFADESIPYNDGMLFPLISSPTLTGVQAGLLYGDTNTPARIVIGSQSTAYPTTAITFKLPYIKNPEVTGTMSIKAYFLNYASGQEYPTTSYLANYPAYDVPLVAALTATGSPSLNIPNFLPQQTTTVDYDNIVFANALDTSSLAYIKFKYLAYGWKYSAITSITCSGYTIDFFHDFYLMLLMPSASQGTAFSIIGCTGFTTADYVESPTTFEVGRYAIGNNNLNTYILTMNMDPHTTVTGTKTQSRATGDYDNANSVTKLTITFSPVSTFKIPGGGRIQITYATANSYMFPGLGRTDCTVVGLNDLGGTAAGAKVVHCYHDSINNELNIEGYTDYQKPADADIVVTYFMKVGLVNTIYCVWKIYDSTGNLMATSGSFTPQLSWNTSTPYNAFTNFAVPVYTLYPLPIYSSTTAPLILQFSLTTGISSPTGSIELEIPAGFAFATGGTPVYYYSNNGGTSYIPTQGTLTGTTALISLVSGFSMDAGATILLYLTTEGAPNGEGMVYPAADLQFFRIKSVVSGAELEAAYYEYILPPPESSGVNISLYLAKTNTATLIDSVFTKGTGYTVGSGYEIEMLFRTNNGLNNLWPTDLGLTYTIERVIAACAEIGGASIITDTDPVNCLAYKTATPGTNNYASVKGKVTKTIANNANVRFLVAGIKTPTASTIKAPIKLRVNKPCRFDNYTCSVFQSEFYYTTTNNNGVPSQQTANAPTLSNPQAKATTVTYTFSLALTVAVTSTSAIVLKPDTAYYNVANDCTTTGGVCASFPVIGWIFFQPTTTKSGTTSFTVIMNNPLWVNDNSAQYYITADTYVGGVYSNLFQVSQPTISKIPITGVSNDAIRTKNPDTTYVEYYLRNFDNIFKMTSPGLYKDTSTKRVEFFMDGNYSVLTSGYCEAYINITTAPAYLKRMDCTTVANYEADVYMVYDPWISGYSSSDFVIFVQGFHKYNAYTGSLSLNAFATYDLTKLNRAYQASQTVTVLADPTVPILTEVAFQEIAFMDRTGKIGDQVDFLAMVLPFSQPADKQIQVFKFIIDSAFGYPPVTSLICYVKGYTDDQRPCTLARTMGQTVVTIDVWDNTTNGYEYDHAAKKLTISNTNETVVFTAPSREGLYNFTGMYYNDSGYLFELDTTTIEIDGSTLTAFNVAHCLDSRISCLHVASFGIDTRSVPIGYESNSSNVKTQIVLQFQIYPAPGFDFDLGTGLANNSEIGCAPYSGITVTYTGKLTCYLIIGDLAKQVDPLILVTGYDEIPASTTAEVLIYNIKTLATGQTSIIKGYIQSFYKDTSQTANYYESSSFTTIAIAGAFTAASGAVTLTPSTITSSVESTITLSVQWALGSTSINSTEWLAIKFPAGFIDFSRLDSTATVTVTAPAIASQAYWLYDDYMVYIQPSGSQVATGTVSVQFANLPAPPYALSGTQTISAWDLDSERKTNYASAAFTSYTNTPATSISDVSLVVSNPYERINDVDYTVSFTVGHDVPATGSLLVAFPPLLYNLANSGPTCEFVTGIPLVADCVIESSYVQNVRIRLNGQAVTSGTSIKLIVHNVNNPISSASAPVFNIQTYYNALTGSTQVIASVPQTLGSFSASAIIQCGVTITPEISTVNTLTAYTFSIGCGSAIRNNTQIVFQFPGEYTTTELGQGFECEIDNRDILIEDCAFVSPTINIGLRIRKPTSSIQLNVKIRNILNPVSPKTYTNFDVQFYKNKILYAQAASGLQLTLTSSNLLTTSTNDISISLFPNNGGEKAFYFFRLQGVVLTADIYEIQVGFPSNYAAYLGSELVCGTFLADSQFIPDYARNFEDVVDYIALPCSALAKRIVSITNTSAADPLYKLNSGGPSVSIFFFVRNVQNPNLFVTSALNFIVRLLNGENLVYYASGSVSLPFTTPPGLLQLNSLTSSDINLRAKSIYEFELENYVPLPEETDPSAKTYELWLQLPQPFTTSFDGVKNNIIVDSMSSTYTSSPITDIEAFNWNRELFVYVPKPITPTESAISLAISNMTNPSFQSFCDYDTDSWETDTTIRMNLAFVSRRFNNVVAKTFYAMDQSNCLENYKNRFGIAIAGNTILQRGLVQTFTVELEGPAESLTLKPFGPFLLFNPSEVTFSDFNSSSFTFQATISDNAQTGSYTMQWHKTESNSNGQDAFLNVEDLQYTIIDTYDASNQIPQPTASMDTFSVLRIGADALEKFMNLTMGPASDLSVEISLANEDSSVYIAVDTNSSFSALPVTVTFSDGETSKKIFIKAVNGAVNNVLYFAFSGKNVNAYNAFLPAIPYLVQEQQEISNFDVIGISTLVVGENTATLRVKIADMGTVYYLVTPKMKVNATIEDILAQKYRDNFAQQIIGKTDALGVLIADIHFCDISLSQLRSQTNYQIFVVGRSVYGEISSLATFTFTTNKATPGAKLSIKTLSQVSEARWIAAFSSILQLPEDRFTTTNTSLLIGGLRLLTSSDIYGFLPYMNEVVIRPSLDNNSPSPMELAAKILEEEQQRKLLAQIPEIETSETYKIYELQDDPPYVIVNASVLDIGFYNITVHLELGTLGKVFATIAERNSQSLLQPYSQQVYYGYLADNTYVDSRKYANAATDINGGVNFTFEELKDNKDYVIHITAGNSLPYDPVDLLTDEQVLTLEAKTHKNPNLGTLNEAEDAYKEYYSSSVKIYTSFLLVLALFAVWIV